MKFAIHVNKPIGPARHCATGSLCGVTESLPSVEAIADIRPSVLVNPALCGKGHLLPFPAEALGVALRTKEIKGVTEMVRFSDILTGWYDLRGMDDWNQTVTQCVLKNKEVNPGNIYGYEIWNEPDGSWHGSHNMPIDEEVMYFIWPKLEVPADGTYTLSIRYANGNPEDVVMDLSVNYGPAQKVHFPTTGKWFRSGAYTDLRLSVEFQEGINKFKLSKDSDIYAEIDYIDVFDAEGNKITRISMDAVTRSGYALCENGYAASRKTDFLTFDEFYSSTQKLIKSLDPDAKTVGPAYAIYPHQGMYNFLKYQKEHGTLPDIVCWHQLADEDFMANYADYRAIEKELGIDPLPISINEYSGGEWSDDEGAPGPSAAVIAKFERCAVDSACISCWRGGGQLGSLLTKEQKPNAGYWFYKWYADLTGDMLYITEAAPGEVRAMDAFGSFDKEAGTIDILFGGENPEAKAEMTFCGIPAEFGNQVRVTAEHLEWADNTTPSEGSVVDWEQIVSVTDGQFTVSVDCPAKRNGYRLLVSKV